MSKFILRFEKIFFGVLFGAIFPLLLGLITFIFWFYFDMLEKHAPYYLFAGILLGLIVDLKYLKVLLNNRYGLPVWFILAVYLFCNIIMFGFFMGFPVFNILMGLVAGYYWGCRIVFKNTPHFQRTKQIKQISLLSGIIMTLICISSGFLALTGDGSGTDIKGMLGLGFTITKPMIWGIVLIGGFLLISGQMVLTRFAIIKTIKIYETNKS